MHFFLVGSSRACGSGVSCLLGWSGGLSKYSMSGKPVTHLVTRTHGIERYRALNPHKHRVLNSREAFFLMFLCSGPSVESHHPGLWLGSII